MLEIEPGQQCGRPACSLTLLWPWTSYCLSPLTSSWLKQSLLSFRQLLRLVHTSHRLKFFTKVMPTQYIVLLFFLPLCFQRRMRIEEEYSKHARATISKLKVSLLNAQQLFFMTVILMEGKFILLIIKYVEFERLH